ncbi:hypothetical protein V8E36_004468 [Tilletia maclaganii]
MAAQSSSDAEEAGSQEPLDHRQRRQQTLDALLDLSPDSVQKVLAAVKRNAHIHAEAEDVDEALFPATGTNKHAGFLTAKATAVPAGAGTTPRAFQLPTETTGTILPSSWGQTASRSHARQQAVYPSHQAATAPAVSTAGPSTSGLSAISPIASAWPSWTGTATGTGFGGHSQTGHLQRAVTTSALPPVAFQSGRQWSASVSLPHSSVLGKVASSTYVPLWHFTPEGIRAGYEKGMTTTKTGRALIEQLGAQVELADVKVADGRMSFHQFFAAANTWVAAIRHCAVTAQDPVAASMLSQEAEGWGMAMQNLLSAPEAKTPEGWKFQARYAEMLRRPSQHRGQKGTLSGGGGTYASGSRGSGSQPFPTGPQDRDRFDQGACIICGRTLRAQHHHFSSCQGTPRGRTAPHTKRVGPAGGLVRVSDGSSVCIWFNRKDVSANHATTTSAPCAATTPTAPNLVASSSMRRQAQQEDESQALRVPAEARRLKPGAFQKALVELNLEHAFPGLVEGLRNGFSFGIPPITQTRTPPNHRSARENLEGLREVAEKEVKKGRWVGPFSQQEVEAQLGPFQSSPLGLIPKASGALRLVQDFSWPTSGPFSSINAYLESDEFITTWDGAREAVSAILDLPASIRGGTGDAEEAYRPCMALPSQLPGLVDLGFPWHPAKTVEFSTTPRYIGWEWRVSERKVVLPREKADTYAVRARSFISPDKRSLDEVEVLLGSCQHVAFFARELSPYLRELAIFSTAFDSCTFRLR